MKKSILAIAISTVAFGAVATEAPKLGDELKTAPTEVKLAVKSALSIADGVWDTDGDQIVVGTAPNTYTIEKTATGFNVVGAGNKGGIDVDVTKTDDGYSYIDVNGNPQTITTEEITTRLKQTHTVPLTEAAKTHYADTNRVKYDDLNEAEKIVVKGYAKLANDNDTYRTDIVAWAKNTAVDVDNDGLNDEFESALAANSDLIKSYVSGKDLRDIDSGTNDNVYQHIKTEIKAEIASAKLVLENESATDEDKAAAQAKLDNITGLVSAKFANVVADKEWRNAENGSGEFTQTQRENFAKEKMAKADKHIDFAAKKGVTVNNITATTNANGETVYVFEYSVVGEAGVTATKGMTQEQLAAAAKQAVANNEGRNGKNPENPDQDLTPEEREQNLKEAGKKLVESGKITKEQLEVAVQNLTSSGQSLTGYAQAQASVYATQDERITQNEQDIFFLKDEVKRLDEKMDGVMAGVHAVNNARPYLMGEGDTAIGAGVGYAGSAGAVAFGAAHAFTDSLSASMTLNVTTGSYSEVSGGAGVQYKF